MLRTGLVIVTRQEAVRPLTVVAIRRTTPALCAVKLPLASTVAAPVTGSTDQRMVLGCASSGVTTAVKRVVCPATTSAVAGSETPVGILPT